VDVRPRLKTVLTRNLESPDAATMRFRDKGSDMAGIFIVEDDTSVQMLLRIALRTRNHEVVGLPSISFAERLLT